MSHRTGSDNVKVSDGGQKTVARNKSTALSSNRKRSSSQDVPSVSYVAEKIIDNGSFGVVFMAKVVESNEIVAIKKVLQDKRFKNRELQIMRMLKHPNVIDLKHCFYSKGDKADELYLNLVLDYVPTTIYKLAKQFQKSESTDSSDAVVPLLWIKLHAYQLLRSIGYIHARGVCHRDVKPQNLLVDPVSQVLKLCDFGSAKVLVVGEPNVSYICSRYYRAPELIFGSTKYTCAIDLWSVGCVCAEMMLGRPLFPGESGVDQLVEIIKVLGTPTSEQIRSMNRHYKDFKFPSIKAKSWSDVFEAAPRKVPETAISLLSSLLRYEPEYRIKPLQSLLHPFFDELREPTTTLKDGKPLPPLFNFVDVEFCAEPTLDWEKMIPKHARNKNNWPPKTVVTSLDALNAKDSKKMRGNATFDSSEKAKNGTS